MADEEKKAAGKTVVRKTVTRRVTTVKNGETVTTETTTSSITSADDADLAQAETQMDEHLKNADALFDDMGKAFAETSERMKTMWNPFEDRFGWKKKAVKEKT